MNSMKTTASSALQRRKTAGFTLVELMVVLSIVAIILTLAAPGFSTLMQRTRLKSYANEFVTSVYLARGEAIKRNVQMRLCSSTGVSPPACDGGGGWEQGWIVVDPNDMVITQQAGFNNGFLMFEISSVGFSQMTFDPSGVANTVASFKICQNAPDDGIEEKEVIVSATGRPRVNTINTGCP